MTLKRLILISRPILYLPTLTVFTAGYVLSNNMFDLSVLLGAFLFTFPANLVMLGFNDIYDRESDLINMRKGGKDGAVLTLNESKNIYKYVIATVAICLITSIFYCGLGYTLAIGTFFLFSYLYSVPPIRLKTRPPLDSLSNGVLYLSIFLAGYWVGTKDGTLSLPDISILVMILCFIFALHAFYSLQDYMVDKNIGDKTIAVKFGLSATKLMCLLLYTVSFVLFLNWKPVTLASSILLLYIFCCIVTSAVALFINDPQKLRKLVFVDILLAPIAAILFIFVRYLT